MGFSYPNSLLICTLTITWGLDNQGSTVLVYLSMGVRVHARKCTVSWLTIVVHFMITTE